MASVLKLKKSNCKNCYKCIRHCPVKSIRFSGNQAHIVEDECILCGQCVVVCPQNAKQIADSTELVKVLISSGEPVIASIAPSFVANYGVGIESIKDALFKLGFADVEETAIGATIVKNEYDRLLCEENRNMLISSCCHSVNLLIQKYYPALVGYLADVVSPMIAHSLDIKKRIPSAKTVFIGPCVSKKDEASKSNGAVDAVLTFEELTNWLEDENIKLEDKKDSIEKSKARLFPTSGGVLKTMKKQRQDITYITVDGIDNCIAALEDINQGNITDCFIEMSLCAGSCIGGPVMGKNHHSPVRDYKVISQYAGNEDFEVITPKLTEIRKAYSNLSPMERTPSETEIMATLRQMGKVRKEDELNCGSCGYNTCREKAVAIINGKADLSMCLPFLKDKAESFSDNIINTTPNGIFVLNESLEVQQINRAALKIMNLKSASDVLGEQVVRILDPKVFMDVLNTHVGVKDERVFLAEYNRYVEQSVVYDRESRTVICIMRDVTDEECQRDKKEKIARQTAEIADNGVDKQMRIVHEIASLLGETAAETKIALTKLKESISDE